MDNKTAIFRLTKPDRTMSDKEKIKCLANNTGNLVFDNALGKIIKGDSIYDCTDIEVLKQYERFITTSYIWLRQNEPLQTSFSLVGDKPYIPMSVGIQAADYDNNFIIHRDVVNELKEISERCVIGCRGYYTAEILNKYGIKNIQVIGCPSMYTNIFGDWHVTKNNVEHMKVAANFSTFWRKLKPYETDFLTYISNHKYNFVEQTEKRFEMSYVDEVDTSSKIKNWLDNYNIFYSYDEWSDFIRQYDFSIGYRFHGNVIALNNNVPALFIYSDSRVKEMCEFFKLPMISDKEFDPSKSIEYWYDLADYSEYNKTQVQRIEAFKEFCRKNAIELADDVHKKENIKNTEKIEIRSNSNFILGKGWNFIEFEDKYLFYADSNMTCRHLKIKLSQTLQSGKEYFLKFRVKFKTSSKGIRFFIHNGKENFQPLCFLNNDNIDDYYDVATTIYCDYDCNYLSVTSTDFTGDNYFIISEIIVEKITNSHVDNTNDMDSLLFYTGTYAENSCGMGSVFDYLNDIGEKQVSVFANEKGIMKALHAMLSEAGVTVYEEISQHEMSYTLAGYKYNTIALDDIIKSKKTHYKSDVPILLCGNVDNFTLKKLNSICNKVYSILDVFKYAIVKNCILLPAYKYFRDKKQKVKIIDLNMVQIKDIKEPSDYEKQIMAGNYKYQSDFIYDDPDYKNKIAETKGPFWRETGKKLVYIDVCNDNCIAYNGIRRTFYQPENPEHAIWFIGVSVSSGAGYVIDEDTIESYLQKILNENMPEKYIVHNVIMPCGWHYGNYYRIIRELPIRECDIIIFSDNYSSVFNDSRFITENIENLSVLLDLKKYFQRPHDMGEIFVDNIHMNPRGYLRYAYAIYKELSERNMFDIKENAENGASHDTVDSSVPEGLAKYLDNILPLKKEGINGCIVMNCNPFTLGHRYLVEYASAQVDNLYIFVVEEDKSMFSFNDRIALVREGTKDIENVTVIPSGKFIISSLTFKAYFEKGEKQDIAVDTTQDLQIFGKYIAKALNISVRFAGSEPLDKITSQYNANMKLLLPQYGVKFEEIPRKECEAEVISASRVRKLLKEEDWQTISKLVPKTTLDFLKKLK